MATEKETTKAEPTADVLEKLLDKIAAMTSGGGGITADQLETLLQKTAGQTADAMRSALIPENKIHPHISAFSYPEGDVARPKPKLTRETFFCGVRQGEDTLMPHEIEAFNAIQQDADWRGDGDYGARLNKSGTKERLFVSVPCKEIDQRMGLPSLYEICVELAHGPKAIDVPALVAELNAMKAKLEKAGVAA